MKAAIIEREYKAWFLVIEPDNWVAGPTMYGPFLSPFDILRQMREYFPHLLENGKEKYVIDRLSRGHWTPEEEIRFTLLTQAAIPPYPVRVGKPPASINFMAMEVECECGSTDLQLELLDIEARAFPNGPWNIRCNECGDLTDCYGIAARS